jgi:hypothetical protein
MARAPRPSPTKPPAPAARGRALRAWENEGGRLAPPQPSPGIAVSQIAQYQVGPYRYTDLACAEAELRRQQAG